MQGEAGKASAQEAVELAHQGWALTRHEPEGGARHGCDVLFLHGMATGSWIWTEPWLSHFTAAGHRAWTMTLPGREAGATIGTDPRAFDRAIALALGRGEPSAVVDAVMAALPGAPLFDGPDLDDYTDALAEALAAIGGPVVVIGHSLGGAVAQNLLRRGTRPAGTVLLCSAPPYGTWRAAMELALTDLRLWKALFDFSVFGPGAVDAGMMRRALFPGGIDAARFRRLLAGLTDESLAATARAWGFPPFAPLPGPRADVLVIGGGRDRLVPPLDIHLTGLYYATRPRVVAGAGHLPMYEPHSAPETARIILDWLPRERPAWAPASGVRAQVCLPA